MPQASPGAHLLVVDDEPELLALLRVVLEGEGFTVTGVPSGAAALAQLAANRPACILLDLQMPGMDGWEFLDEARARFGTLPPVVLMTASLPADLDLVARGIAVYLAKPFDMHEIIDAARLCVGAPVAHPSAH